MLYPLAASAVDGEAVRAARDRAVLLARDGGHAEAIDTLHALLSRHPDAVGVRADLVTVLEWAGRYGDAAAAAEGLIPGSLDDYALLAWARALRGQRELDRAYRLLEPRIEDAARSPDVGVLAALLLADLERVAEAGALIEDMRERHRDSAEAAAAAAYIFRLLQRTVEALSAAGHALKLAPEHAEARRQQVFALADLGAAERALELALEHGRHFTTEEVERLRADQAAQPVYWARAHRDFPERSRKTAAVAVTRLETLLDEPDLGEEARRRLRYDHVVALREHQRMAEATAAYETLLADGLAPPLYVLEAAADAYLHQRRPREAVPLYRTVLQDDPWRFDARMSLFYALIESERFDEALTLIDALALEKPTHLDIDGTDQREPYWRRLNVDLAAAMARAFTNRHAEAQRRLEALAADAPASAQVRRELSTLYRWRGWPERALAQAEIAQRYEPEIVAGRLAHGEALIDLGRFAEADAAIARLYADHPDDARVARQRERWDDRRRWRLEIETRHGDSDGFSELGTRDRQARIRLTAPPIGHYWRPYLYGAYSHGRFPEGTADHDRAGVGIDYRQGRRRAYAEVHGNRSGKPETGMTAGFDWHLDDHWSFAARGESFSMDVPLRARGQGLDAWKVEGAVRWQAHESLDVYGGWSRLDIADGNVRLGAWLGSEHRLRGRARHVTTGSADLYLSRARSEGGLYFNPTRESAFQYTLSHDWITWRRYERAFTQSFVAGAGAYRQSGFGTGATTLLGYEHRWQLGRNLSLGYGAAVSSRPYDGARERRAEGFLSLEARL